MDSNASVYMVANMLTSGVNEIINEIVPKTVDCL